MIVEVGFNSMPTKHVFRDLLLNAGFKDRSNILGKNLMKFKIDTDALRFITLHLKAEESIPILSSKNVEVLSILNVDAFKALICSDSLREFVWFNLN